MVILIKSQNVELNSGIRITMCFRIRIKIRQVTETDLETEFVYKSKSDLESGLELGSGFQILKH